MRRSSRAIDNLSSNPWFVVVGIISSIASFIWFMYDKMKQSATLLSGSASIFTLFFLLFGYFYSIRVRSENVALRKIAETFNEINQIYRDTLRETFCSDNPKTNLQDLLEVEKRILHAVCQRIENIYSRVINRDCLVTIKLVIKEEDGKYYAHTYVRSLDKCARDEPVRVKYEVGTGQNTAFDAAIQRKSNGIPSHFFSADITKDKSYCNQRQHFSNFYNSAIVVPIRGVNKDKVSTDNEYDMIGYLCVDTKSKNRLNDGYHLQMLSSLASQMYNFMSLMRGKYTVTVR